MYSLEIVDGWGNMRSRSEMKAWFGYSPGLSSAHWSLAHWRRNCDKFISLFTFHLGGNDV